MMGVIWSLLGILSRRLHRHPGADQRAAGARARLCRCAAAAFSFLSGAIVLGIVSVLIVRLQGMSLDWRAPAPWLFVVGGLLGGSYVTIATILAPRIGAAALMAFAVTGQLLAGMLIDRVGFLGAGGARDLARPHRRGRAAAGRGAADPA